MHLIYSGNWVWLDLARFRGIRQITVCLEEFPNRVLYEPDSQPIEFSKSVHSPKTISQSDYNPTKFSKSEIVRQNSQNQYIIQRFYI